MDIKRRLNNAYKPASSAENAENKKPSGNTHKKAQNSPKTSPIPASVEKAIAVSESFLKTGRSGIEKAARFLLLLGRDEAANVIKHLKPAEIERVSREIALIDSISTEEANDILTEFGWMAKLKGVSLQGGPEIAESMLEAAFGEEKAKEVLKKAVPNNYKPFSFLEDFDAKQLTVLFKEETPQLSAMILPYLSPKLASSILAELPLQLRTEVIKRIARLDPSPPDVLERVEAALKDKAARIGRLDSGEAINGAEVLAGILRHVDSKLESSILGGIAELDPELSKTIKERLFTTEDLLRVSDRDMQKQLRELSEQETALLLKGKSQAFRDKVLNNVSQAKRILILEEYDILGTVRREDVERATKSFLGVFKKRWEEGKLVLEGDDDLID